MSSYASMMKELMGTAQDIQQTAKKIAKKPAIKQYFDSIYPGKTNLINELNQTITNDPKMSAKWMDERVQKRVSDTLEDLVPKDKIEELSQTVHSATYSDDIDELAKSIGQYTDKADIASKIMKDEAKEVIDNGLDNIKPGLYDKITKYPQAYFKNPDKKVRNARIGTAIGAYTALSVGGRYLQGGTLTTDQYGRKDIAGIPFL